MVTRQWGRDSMFVDIAKVMGHDDLIEGFRVDARIPDGNTCGMGAHIGGIHVLIGVSPGRNTRDLLKFANDLGGGIGYALLALVIEIMDGKVPVELNTGGNKTPRACDDGP